VSVDERRRGDHRGVVAFDVDGILLRRLFLSRLAWRRGLWVWLRSVWVGLLLKTGFITIRCAVERAYCLQRGTRIAEVMELAGSLRLSRGAAKVCKALRESGYIVVLVSAGVPQRVIERIAARVGADRACGILLGVEDGVMTGRLLGNRHSAEGKRDALEGILSDLGFGWTETTVVVDDRSNEAIVDAAWRSVGVNPELAILRKATFVLHTNDLSEVLEFFPEGYRVGITPQWLAARHELFRKTIHIGAAIVPFLAAWSRGFTLWLVGLAGTLFVLSEVARVQGVAVPIVSTITWRAMRSSESRGIAAGPILFGVGIWLTLRFFPLHAATVGILVLAAGDTAASLVGRAFGETLLPHNPGKTVVGSLSLFTVGVIIAMFYTPLPWAFLVGATAMLVESLPVRGLDNLLLPLTTAGISMMAGAPI
jgi:phytol kinase